MASPTRASTDPAPRRSYRSPRREQQAKATRDALLAAATDLFTTRGWANTGMRDIARQAGVATETIYSHFSSKAELLQRAIDIAVVGDDAAIPVARRPEFADMGTGTRPERIAAAARLVTGIHARTDGFAKVLREAAPTDESIAEVLRATRERQRVDVGAGMTLVLGRPPTPEELDTTWALLSVEVYLLLVEESGWSAARYEAWLNALLEATIPNN